MNKLFMLCLLLCLSVSASSTDLAPVETRRGKTELSKLADSMQPGAWAELKTQGLKGDILMAPPPARGGLSIMGWTDDAFWDSRTGQFIFMGLRQARRFIAYSELTNTWSEIVLPEDHKSAGSPPRATQYGHIYSRNALDPENSQFYHMDHNEGGGVYRYDILTGKWTKLPEGANTNMTGTIEYFSAMKGVINLGSGNTKKGINFFSEAQQTWRDLGSTAVCGYHSLGRHNPFRQEVLLAGGNQSPKAVARVTKDGKIEALKDAPIDLTIRHGRITVDPQSGKYLILDESIKKMYEFDSTANEYRLIEDFNQTRWPFGNHDMPVVAFIPEYNVSMWLGSNSKVVLYKHNPSGASVK